MLGTLPGTRPSRGLLFARCYLDEKGVCASSSMRILAREATYLATTVR